MTDTLLALVVAYGPILLGVITFLSCLALPVPASLMMMAGGGFVASGDMTATATVSAALGGAILGDQTGFWGGRLFSTSLGSWMQARPKRKKLQERANNFVDKWGSVGIFLSRWLVSPLGPYVNLMAGSTELAWPRFLLWAVLGELVWVSIYTGLGFAFAGQITEISTLLGNASGVLAAGVVMIGSGLWLRRSLRKHNATKRERAVS